MQEILNSEFTEGRWFEPRSGPTFLPVLKNQNFHIPWGFWPRGAQICSKLVILFFLEWHKVEVRRPESCALGARTSLFYLW